MPLYEYRCPKCNDEFELLIRGEEKAACPKCGEQKVEKLLSVPAAPSTGTSDLPVAGTCGRPQCGMGGCQGLGGL